MATRTRSPPPTALVPRVAPIPALPNVHDHLRVLRSPVRGPELGAVEIAVPRVHPVLPAVAIGLRRVLPRVVEVVVGGEVHEVIVHNEIRIIRVVDTRAGPGTKVAQNVDVPHLPPADGGAKEREKEKTRHGEESDTSLYGEAEGGRAALCQVGTHRVCRAWWRGAMSGAGACAAGGEGQSFYEVEPISFNG